MLTGQMWPLFHKINPPQMRDKLQYEQGAIPLNLLYFGFLGYFINSAMTKSWQSQWDAGFYRLLNFFTLLGLYFFSPQRTVVGVCNSNKITENFLGSHKIGWVAEERK